MRYLKRPCLVGLAAIAVASTPLRAEAASAPANELGLGFGESTGIGLLYQRALGDGWRGRLNLGLAPTSNGWTPGSSSPPPFTWVFAGGGMLRDLHVAEGGRLYALGTVLYKRVSPNMEHRSITPGLGYQYGPLLTELGVSFYETLRDGGQRMYVRWGWSLSLGLGVVWGF